MKVKFEILKEYSTTLEAVRFYVIINDRVWMSYATEQEARDYIEKFDTSILEKKTVFIKEVII